MGNLQVSVTANVNHSAFERGTSLVNANLQTYSNGTDYPVAPTTLTVGGVDFALVPQGTSSTSLGALQTPAGTTSFDIPVNIADLDWDRGHLWQHVERAYPYGLSYETHSDRSLDPIEK